MAKGLRRVAGGGGGDHSLSLGAGRGSKKRARLRKEGRGGEDGAVWGGAGRGGSAPQGQGGRLFARCAGGRSPALSGLAGGERRGPSLRPQRRARTGGSACNEGGSSLLRAPPRRHRAAGPLSQLPRVGFHVADFEPAPTAGLSRRKAAGCGARPGAGERLPPPPRRGRPGVGASQSLAVTPFA